MATEHMTGRERTGLLYLVMLDDSIYKNGEALKNRLKGVSRNGWRDLRLVQKTTQRLIDSLVQTLDAKDSQWIDRAVRYGKVGVSMPGPLKEKEWQIIDNDDLMLIARAAMENQCSMCMLEGRDVKRCKLREAITRVYPYPDRHTGALCEYAALDWEE